MKYRLTVLVIAAALITMAWSVPGHAISVTADTGAGSLAATLTGGSTGIVWNWALLNFHSSGGAESSGTYSNGSFMYGIGPGVVLSSGDVLDYSDGPNTSGSNTTSYGVAATAAQELLLDPLTGGFFTHYDVTELTINFDMLPGYDTVFFNVAFGSDEYPEWVGTAYIDGFGLYLNGVNIAMVGGLPVNINHPDMIPLPGTELDGVLAPGGNPLLLFSGFVGDGSTGNEITFIVADASDDIYDTTAYISALGGTPPNPVPEPGSLMLLGTGLVGVAGWARRKMTKV